MSNPFHLQQLLQGIAAWNLWRVENPDCRPDLRGAYLQGQNLARINLSDADLRFAFLFRVNLRSANLRGAVLTGADLIQAQLQDADLRNAVLSGVYLTRADLTHADLTGADLRGAMLRNAILEQTTLPPGEPKTGIRRRSLALSAAPQSPVISFAPPVLRSPPRPPVTVLTPTPSSAPPALTGAEIIPPVFKQKISHKTRAVQVDKKGLSFPDDAP